MTIEELTRLELQAEEVEKMGSSLHAGIGGAIVGALYSYLENNSTGQVLDSSATYDFKDGLPKRQPDISFVTLEKLPMLMDEELTVVPDLAVEVVSRNDKIYEVEAKVRQYQQAGVGLIWVIYPVSRTVGIYRTTTGLTPQFIGTEAELEGENILPGFKLAVNKLFKRAALI